MSQPDDGKQQERPEPQAGVGLICLKCGCRHFYCDKTVPARKGYIRRRRICRNCGAVHTSVERIISAR